MRSITYNYKQSNITSGSLYAVTYTRCPENNKNSQSQSSLVRQFRGRKKRGRAAACAEQSKAKDSSKRDHVP